MRIEADVIGPTIGISCCHESQDGDTAQSANPSREGGAGLITARVVVGPSFAFVEGDGRRRMLNLH